MIIEEINPGIYKIDVQIKSIIHGNTFVDSLTGWDQIESTTLKLRCTDCTVMVFKGDMKIFKDFRVGDRFQAIVSEWKKDIYNFKRIIN